MLVVIRLNIFKIENQIIDLQKIQVLDLLDMSSIIILVQGISWQNGELYQETIKMFL